MSDSRLAGNDPQLPWFEDDGIESLPRKDQDEFPGIIEFIDNLEPLYLDDIEKLYSILTRNATGLEMKTELFRFRSPQHFPKVPQEVIRELTFSTVTPKTDTEFSIGRCRMMVWDRSDETLSLLSEIREIANARKSLHPRARYWLPMVPVIAGSFLPAILAWAILASTKELKIAIWVLLVVDLLVVLVARVLVPIKSPNGLAFLFHKRDTPNPWYTSDNMKVSLATGFLLAVVAAFFSGIIGYYIGQK